MNSLAMEAAAWKLGRKPLKGPENRDHFIIEQEGRFWRLSIHPKTGLPQVINGLTFPEAMRRRLRLSDDGYVGKIVGAL